MKRSPLAVRMIKRAMNAELDGQHGLMEFAGDATLLYYLTAEAQEGKNAFLEKRDPDFQQFPKFPWSKVLTPKKNIGVDSKIWGMYFD